MILVTGATGTVGSEVVRQLVLADIPVRALVRSPEKAAQVLDPHIPLAIGDFEHPETLIAAMRDVEKVFLASPGHPTMEGNAIRAAKQAGVKHIVKLSALGASPFSPVTFIRWHWQSEKYIEESGLGWTHIRPTVFMQNLVTFSPTIKTEGKFFSPVKSGKVSVIDVRDIAAVAVASLTRRGHKFKTYELTGPEALTQAEMAEKLSAAAGKPVARVGLNADIARQMMLGAGLPERLVEDLILFDGYLDMNYASSVLHTVKHVAKKQPFTFDQFARDYVEAFV